MQHMKGTFQTEIPEMELPSDGVSVSKHQQQVFPFFLQVPRNLFQIQEK